jgi:hypothetical protein
MLGLMHMNALISTLIEGNVVSGRTRVLISGTSPACKVLKGLRPFDTLYATRGNLHAKHGYFVRLDEASPSVSAR